MQGLHTSFNKIALVISARTEGLSFNSTCRVHNISTHTLQSWEDRFSKLKHVLMAYALAHSFVSQIIEGDELYTKVGSNIPQEDSEGWTIVFMDRASRFIWELECGKKDKKLFMSAIRRLAHIIESTGDLSLITDGERRYGNTLFEICYELLKTGKPGRPKKVLKQGVKVRIKNKGSQSHKRGRKKPKYEAPKSEHPMTQQDIENHAIHANHSEAFNAALRRKSSPYRRKTNTYAKIKPALQRILDVYWVVHNFIRKHFTTKEVPAVKLGIIENKMSFYDLLTKVTLGWV